MKKHLSIGFMTLALMCATQTMAQNYNWESSKGDSRDYWYDKSGHGVDEPKGSLPEMRENVGTIDNYDDYDRGHYGRKGEVHSQRATGASSKTSGKRKQIVFKRGRSSGIVTGKVKGWANDDYEFVAKRGQSVDVDFIKGIHVVSYVMTDDGESLVLPVESLPYSGKYILRFGLTRNKAREKTTHSYKAKVIITD